MLQAAKLPDGSFTINRNNTFGGGASGRCWWCLMSLVLWVARRHFGCENLHDYVDDVFSSSFIDTLTLYPRYNIQMPFIQVQFLLCLDSLRVPHDLVKQLWGRSLPVTGLEVDRNRLLITMPESSRHELLAALDTFITFCAHAPPSRRCRTLRECQALAGHVIWGLNVFPRLRPGLASLYSKMDGPYHPSKTVHLNTSIVWDLTWLSTRICASLGIFLLDSIAWRSNKADLVLYMDACPAGLGFWCPQLDSGCYADMISSAIDLPIFYHEASAVVCALHWFTQFGLNDAHRLTIYSDNTSTMDIFSTLKARNRYNELLKLAMDILMDGDLDLRVLHIASVSNTVAECSLPSSLSDCSLSSPNTSDLLL